MRLLIAALFIVVLGSCVKGKRFTGAPFDSTYYTENHRPQFHFSPAKNWTNDPNGLVYYEGEYHLFYQYNPYGDTWGHMSWGHAVSKDLVHWEHLPLALNEYQDPGTGDSTMIFSGTVVVDKDNSSGLCNGKDCLVAIYTSNVHKDNQGLRQHQSLAYSNDMGRTWERYDKNPILDIQRKDFRDPKVFWYEPKQFWVMALVIPDKYIVRFYTSKNLLDWSPLSEFGGMGDTTRIWECPDLYEVPVENESGKSKWVLSLSGGHPQGPAFVGMQYFVGNFDGERFTLDDPKQPNLYVDYGKDFYAGIVVNNLPAQARNPIMIGWVNNWTYANQIPTSPWRGAMSIPRVLSLRNTYNGYRLIQHPVQSVYNQHGNEVIDLNQPLGKSMEFEVIIILRSAQRAGVTILKNENEETVIGYDVKTKELYIDRSHSGVIGFNKEFPTIERVKVSPVNDQITLSIFVDQSIVEVFINGGELVLTEQIFPTHDKVFYKTWSDNGGASIATVAWELNSVWR